MSTGKQLTALLLLTTALTIPGAAYAQETGIGTGAEGVPAEEDPATDAVLAQQVEGIDDTPAEEEFEEPEISVPGGAIVVTGRRRQDVTRASSQVVSVLDSASIARTGEGDIAGALTRVTGLSTVGNGLVFVRGLGDRYSLALLNGLPLPSPQPLSRVVPLDIFPTSIIASSLVQKTYSANFPGEFGGGVINLTTRAVPDESFIKISAGISGDSETNFGTGYTYYGSSYDWFGFDDGRRTTRPALQNYLDSGVPISDPSVDQRSILLELGDPNLILLQSTDNLPANWSTGITAGTSFDVFSDGRFGIIATASLSNKWRNRFITRQTAVNADLDLDTDFRQFTTDQRILANAMLGFGLEVGEHRFRIVNLFIRDSLKRASLAEGTDFQNDDTDQVQDTAWYERQLFDTQFTGELEFGDLSIDLRGGYAQTQREAPYEWEFTYTRTNNANDPLGNVFLNTLDPQRGGAVVAFSDLTEDLYYGGVDLSYQLADWLGVTVGGAYTDTERLSSRREFDIRASGGYPDMFGAFRPDNLLGDSLIELGYDPVAQDAAGIGPFTYTIFDTTGSDPAFAAGLEILAGYVQTRIEPTLGVSLDVGVRYEDATQEVIPLGLDGAPSGSGNTTLLENNYFLPGATLTWEVTDSLQLRLNASKTIARPQFRELIFQTYFDPETNRQFNGNPSLVDSELTNYEARLEYYWGSGSKASVAGFYKDIENPIEIFSSFSDNNQISGFANAPSAQLYGAEVELQWNKDLYNLGDWWESKRLVAIANYTYTNSELEVGSGDIARVFPFADQPATNFFRDGVPLTGQSDHLVNLQLGIEDLDKISQATFLLSYASERVTSRGTAALPDIVEDPGLRLDFVVRQGFELSGTDLELKLEARNLTGRDHFEFQTNGTNRIEINSYDVGRSFAVSLSAEF
ncbi:TonB-dependent receptor [Erythrobacter sp.]|uniref:TonB-dependent receptor domain-containing protein n=1 Tax=Erythrobacter sp. TaxID=1042 RepID=UPI001B2F590B|nr:TonB-dependent receptor [Erythrobacter sp.]MBO6527360.1 TonB-dependent receptor [Erythrobacter sp.]MBO6530744.1 TonB-dependent receptor [Erythrobacter sp.]